VEVEVQQYLPQTHRRLLQCQEVLVEVVLRQLVQAQGLLAKAMLEEIAAHQDKVVVAEVEPLLQALLVQHQVVAQVVMVLQ
jgi:hypothetical protein